MSTTDITTYVATDAFCALLCLVRWVPLVSLSFYNGRHDVRCNGRILCARVPHMLGSSGFFIFPQRTSQRTLQRTHFVRSYASCVGVHCLLYISTTDVTKYVATDAFCARVRPQPKSSQCHYQSSGNGVTRKDFSFPLGSRNVPILR
jgi:hypothetical protein